MLASFHRSLIPRFVGFEILAEYYVRHGLVALFAAIYDEDGIAERTQESKSPGAEQDIVYDMEQSYETSALQEIEPLVEEAEKGELNDLKDQSYQPSVD